MFPVTCFIERSSMDKTSTYMSISFKSAAFLVQKPTKQNKRRDN